MCFGCNDHIKMLDTTQNWKICSAASRYFQRANPGMFYMEPIESLILSSADLPSVPTVWFQAAHLMWLQIAQYSSRKLARVRNTTRPRSCLELGVGGSSSCRCFLLFKNPHRMVVSGVRAFLPASYYLENHFVKASTMFVLYHIMREMTTNPRRGCEIAPEKRCSWKVTGLRHTLFLLCCEHGARSKCWVVT